MIQSVQDAPICLGCGLASHVETHAGICSDCWHRRERRIGGGPLRIVTPARTYHETPLCPAVRTAAEWRYWRDEDVVYADLGGDLSKCRRCHRHDWHGFDHYRGDDQVIGHA